jgi:hypothetical protein
MFTDVRQAILPAGTDPVSVIRQAGDIWRSWGWYVVERDDFPQPNQFGYGPDGYRLQIESANPPGNPPTVSAISPCFPGDLAHDDIPVPVILRVLLSRDDGVQCALAISEPKDRLPHVEGTGTAKRDHVRTGTYWPALRARSIAYWFTKLPTGGSPRLHDPSDSPGRLIHR